MFKNSQLLPYFPYVELYLADGRSVDLCKALSVRDARLYHVSDKTPEGVQILERPEWYLDFKHTKGQTKTIELTEEQATEISDHCGAKIETFADGIFWF